MQLDQALGVRIPLGLLALATPIAAIMTAYGIADSKKGDAVEQDSEGQPLEEVNQGGNS